VTLSLDVQGVGAQAPAGGEKMHDHSKMKMLRPKMPKKGIVVAAVLLATSPASAHISLENKQAAIGSSYRAVFGVPHGCAGSATVKLRVRIPEGVTTSSRCRRPAGRLEAISGKYAAEYDYHGSKRTEGSRKWCGAAASSRTTTTMNS